MGAYRFSIAWTRVYPEGSGEVNQAGLDFYRRLVSGLRERGIEPVATLYHWDLPQALQDDGGWPNRATIDAFTEYAGTVASALGDHVGTWITHNEPWVAAFLGHLEGVFAPGLRDWGLALRAAHHILVSHGQATEVIRSETDRAQVGIALDCRPSVPADDESVTANQHFDGFRNRWFFDPVFGLGYPADMLDLYERSGRLGTGLGSFVADGDLEIIATPIDVLGINYYTTIRVEQGSEERDVPEGAVGPNPPPGFTEMGWRIDPAGLYGFLKRVDVEYGPKSIIISENGASFSDGPDSDGQIEDRRRIAYLRDHIREVLRARDGGIPVDGYYVWSFLDNLEWTQGFDQRFGLVWVDPVTTDRIPKSSFYWYQDLISGSM